MQGSAHSGTAVPRSALPSTLYGFWLAWGPQGLYCNRRVHSHGSSWAGPQQIVTFFFFFFLPFHSLSGSLSGLQPSVPSWVPGASTQSHEGTNTPNPTTATPHQQANTAPSAKQTAQDEADFTLPMSGLAPIPAHLVQPIKSGKYVDLDELLPESLREGFFDRPKNKDEPKRTRFHITNPLEWAIAFSNYMAVVVHFYPERAFALAAYQGIVLSLARDVHGNSWLRYDRTFRQLAAVNPDLPWHRREPDVWLATATGSDGSMLPSARPPAARDLPPATRSPPGIPICRSWNQGRCQFPNCRYRHVCLSCRAPGHTSRACPSSKDAKQGTQPGQARPLQ